ncbi:MAG: S8 family serine peptidase [Saprospiraceae bacterium]|nr:S8 family serine peptidase [Saprospiraceae bacterium]MCF8251109.1 S8 family serine peptidase [Saprospiraceae bacterium]MCF8281011.1 S8 family serine peptidase [Bacteroidales bacterium]MCF8312933.1 S8 family serine peptidase [Saprospiraceae bacterium]MCF8441368.1 S8 family serine peptidase [Saprospiraceae bacterium]
MKKSIIFSILLICPFFIKAQQFTTHTPDGVVELALSTEKMVARFKKDVPPSDIKEILSGYRELVLTEPFSPVDTGGTYVINFQPNTTSFDVNRVVAFLKKNPSVVFANPVLVSPGGISQAFLDEIAVGVHGGTALLEIYAAIYGLKIARADEFMGSIYYLKTTATSQFDAIETANRLSETGHFAFAEPVWMRFLKPYTNDPLFYAQWAINNTGNWQNSTPGADMKVDDAWNITTGSSSIKIAIIDDGVQLNHPDLSPNLLTGYDATGYGSAGAPTVIDAHGTACAGIAAAKGNNNIGVAGVAYNCKIIPIRIYYTANNGSFVFFDTWMANGINWAWQTAGADVLSNSWGLGIGTSSSVINTAISGAVNNGRNNKGCPVLFATGNDNEGTVAYPASNSNVIAVGATSPCDQRKSPSSCDGENWWGSNYGSALDVTAPGVLITTTDLTGTNGDNSSNSGFPNDNNYNGYFNGTSSACPNAAGVMALILSVNPNLTQVQARQILESTCDKVGGYTYSTVSGHPNGTWTNQLGYGRLNALAAVQAAGAGSGGCSTPTGLTTTNLKPRTATLNWSTVTGATSYTLELREVGASTWNSFPNMTSNSQFFYYFIPCKNYEFRVRAHCSSTAGSFSTAKQFTTTGCGSYCTAYGYDSTIEPLPDEWIERVTIGSINNTSGNDWGYNDFTNLSTNLTKGNSYTITLTPGFSSSAYPEYWTVWVDYNKDNDFNDTGEKVYTSSNGSSSTVTASFTVPASAVTGATRMRVAMMYDAAPLPCGEFEFGEVEDYSVNISGCAPPAAPTLSQTGTINLCSGSSQTLTATACSGCTINWSNGQTGSSISVSTNGTYTATASNSCGASAASTAATVVVANAPSVPSITANGTTSLCPGQSVTFSANNICQGCTINWSNGQQGASITVNANAPGTYTATASTPNCGTSAASNAITVTTASQPSTPFIIAEGQTALCQGGSVTLSATGVCNGCTVTWSNTQTGPSITVSNAGTYTATVVGSCGMSSASNAIVVNLLAQPFAPTISASSSNPLCSGQSVTLTASNICQGCTVNWSNGSTGLSTTVSGAGNYSATTSNNCGISGTSNTVAVTSEAQAFAPFVTILGSSALCPNESTTLSATNICPGCTVTWSNGQTGLSINVSNPGNYYATATNACGPSGASNIVNVTANTVPSGGTATLSGPNPFCEGQSTTLMANIGTCSNCTVTWSNGQTGNTLNVATPGNYSFTLTNNCGTSPPSNVISITMNSLPQTLNITANGPTVLCPGQSVTLTAANVCAGCTVNWSNVQTGNPITVTSPGNYTATASNSCGTGNPSNSIFVEAEALPPIPQLTPSGTVAWCPGQVTTIVVSNICTGCTVNWSNGQTGNSITVTALGTYTATMTNPCGQQGPASSQTILVEGPLAPQAVILPAGTVGICPGQSVTLTATGCGNCTGVTWSNGATGTSISVNSPGSYTAIYTNSCGPGLASAPTQVTVADYVPEVMVNNQCYLAAPVGTNFQWFFNGNAITGATTQFLVANQTGYYTITMTANNGCLGTSAPLFIQGCTTATKEWAAISALEVFPNPAQDILNFRFEFFQSNNLRLDLLTVDGRLVKTALDGKMASGNHLVKVNVADLAGGVYLYRLRSEEGVSVGWILVVQ